MASRNSRSRTQTRPISSGVWFSLFLVFGIILWFFWRLPLVPFLWLGMLAGGITQQYPVNASGSRKDPPSDKQMMVYHRWKDMLAGLMPNADWLEIRRVSWWMGWMAGMLLGLNGAVWIALVDGLFGFMLAQGWSHYRNRRVDRRHVYKGVSIPAFLTKSPVWARLLSVSMPLLVFAGVLVFVLTGYMSWLSAVTLPGFVFLLLVWLLGRKPQSRYWRELVEGQQLLDGWLAGDDLQKAWSGAYLTQVNKIGSSDNPLIVHITNMGALDKIADIIPEVAYKVADAYWPGPLTMIFQKTEEVPYETTGGLDTVAVRMPSDEIARALIDAGGGYIAAPSANTSGRPSPTKAEHVEEDLSGKIEMILDGGAVDIGVESTILDMTVTPPMILRPGAITKEMLTELIGEVDIDRTLITPDSKVKPKAPGMKYRHYAPKAGLSIVEGPMELVIDAINQMSAERMAKGHRVGVIGTQETVGRYKADVVKSIGTRADEATIANHLYAVLREFDDAEVEYIYSESFAAGGIGSAIMNRLLKAAGHHVIDA